MRMMTKWKKTSTWWNFPELWSEIKNLITVIINWRPAGRITFIELSNPWLDSNVRKKCDFYFISYERLIFKVFVQKIIWPSDIVGDPGPTLQLSSRKKQMDLFHVCDEKIILSILQQFSKTHVMSITFPSTVHKSPLFRTWNPDSV